MVKGGSKQSGSGATVNINGSNVSVSDEVANSRSFERVQPTVNTANKLINTAQNELARLSDQNSLELANARNFVDESIDEVNAMLYGVQQSLNSGDVNRLFIDRQNLDGANTMLSSAINDLIDAGGGYSPLNPERSSRGF